MIWRKQQMLFFMLMPRGNSIAQCGLGIPAAGWYPTKVMGVPKNSSINLLEMFKVAFLPFWVSGYLRKFSRCNLLVN
ncbi:hypothetical protein DAI22_04g105101 [Oryza sativa Japonica Group]|nr:hypothetical protein DAI22_04g105101 [Oryza sativa Japonica Group]KAF2933693.1 hypothetical protein DAI22_04g105101 [Oryza sativa Japonica Group]